MKNKSEISPDELKEKMTQHAIRLGIIKDGISVYCCCLEQETYKESITELWNLGGNIARIHPANKGRI